MSTRAHASSATPAIPCTRCAISPCQGLRACSNASGAFCPKAASKPCLPEHCGLSLGALDNHVDNCGQALYDACKPLICKESLRIACFLGRTTRFIPARAGQSCG